MLRDELADSGPDGWLHREFGTVHPAIGVILPGETWTLQMIFRDQVPGGACNVTNATAVTFQ
ncbi:MAG: hypothetical protein GY711_32360 [bacterium]|nr:hypothetical protein [bacterium]